MRFVNAGTIFRPMPDCLNCNDTGEDEISDVWLAFVPCSHCKQGPIAENAELKRQLASHEREARRLRKKLSEMVG